jgi:hypothetical protein
MTNEVKEKNIRQTSLKKTAKIALICILFCIKYNVL